MSSNPTTTSPSEPTPTTNSKPTWLFASGSSWVPFESSSQINMEASWEGGFSHVFIKDRHFGDAKIFVNLAEGYLEYAREKIMVCRVILSGQDSYLTQT